jgi:hypothetical protein
MRCPKCSGPVGRKDMVAPLAWTSFVCPGCKAHLDATRVSQTLIIVTVGVVSTIIAWLFGAVGLGGITSIAVGAVTLLAGIPLGMGAFAHLMVHRSEHPSVAS